MIQFSHFIKALSSGKNYLIGEVGGYNDESKLKMPESSAQSQLGNSTWLIDATSILAALTEKSFGTMNTLKHRPSIVQITGNIITAQNFIASMF